MQMPLPHLGFGSRRRPQKEGAAAAALYAEGAAPALKARGAAGSASWQPALEGAETVAR